MAASPPDFSPSDSPSFLLPKPPKMDLRRDSLGLVDLTVSVPVVVLASCGAVVVLAGAAETSSLVPEVAPKASSMVVAGVAEDVAVGALAAGAATAEGARAGSSVFVTVSMAVSSLGGTAGPSAVFSTFSASLASRLLDGDRVRLARPPKSPPRNDSFSFLGETAFSFFSSIFAASVLSPVDVVPVVGSAAAGRAAGRADSSDLTSAMPLTGATEVSSAVVVAAAGVAEVAVSSFAEVDGMVSDSFFSVVGLLTFW